MNPTRSQLLAVTFALLVVVPGAALGAVVGEPDLSANLVGGPLTAGEDTALTVQIQNSGQATQGSEANPSLNSRVTTARSVEVRLTEWDDSPIEIETGRVFLGSVQDGALQTADFDVSVPEDAESGTYTLRVRVDYDYIRSVNAGNEEQRSKRENFYVDVRVEDSSQFRVVDVNSDVAVGESGDVELTLRNTGRQDATDATVSLTSQNGAVTLGGAESASRYVGAGGAGEDRTVTFDAAVDAGAGRQPYALTAQVDYEDDDGDAATSKSLATSVRPAPEQTFDLSETNGTLRVGRDGAVGGTVTNTGPNTAYDAEVVVQSEYPGVSFEERRYALGTLEPDDSATFELPVELSDSASRGQKQLSYVVEYQNDDDDQRTSKRLNTRVEVREKVPLFDVEATNATVETGETATVELLVTNNADETLRNIDAKAFVDDPLTLSNDEGFIPQLRPGESETFTVQVSSGSNALARQYALSVDFQYDDAEFETKLSDTYTVGVTVVEPSDDGRTPVMLIVGVLVVVVAAAGIVWYRRR